MIGSVRGLEFDKLADYFLNEDYRKTGKLRNKLSKRHSKVLDYLILARNTSAVVLYAGVIVFLVMTICGYF
jgi:hypothetical protein